MRMTGWTVLLSLAVPAVAAAADPEVPATVAAANALLDAAAEALAAYESDTEAQAAAPDAIRQAGDAIEEARGRLVERGIEGAETSIRRVRVLLDLIAELVRARALEQEAESLTEAVVAALERLAVAQAAYERVTEQLHLHAVPFPGEVGP